jgi:hypothetical protein
MRADERRITPDMYLATLRGGCVESLGKHFVKFSKDYKKFKIICIGKVFHDRIDITKTSLFPNLKDGVFNERFLG